MNEAKVHTVVELGGFDTKSLLCDVGDFEESEKQQQQQKQLPIKNSLSHRQMKSLVALCDTILPSIIDNNVVSSSDESVNNFYRTSASMAGTPERVGLLQPFLFIYFYLFISLSMFFILFLESLISPETQNSFLLCIAF
jgi:long-chain-alcohol oxidase